VGRHHHVSVSEQQGKVITDKFCEYARAIEPLVEEFVGKIQWYVLMYGIYVQCVIHKHVFPVVAS